MKFLSVFSLLRANSFDLKTESGRHLERYRLAALSMAANLFSKAAAIVLILLSVSLTVDYLSLERFGIWMLALSFVTMLSFLDLGIGNALTNHVAQRSAEDSRIVLRNTISGGLALLGMVGMGIGLLLLAISSLMPWGIFFQNGIGELSSEVRSTAMCFSLLFGLTIFTTGLQRVFSGMQLSFIAHLVSALAALLSCLALWIAAHFHQDIEILLLAVLGVQSLVNLMLLPMLWRKGLFSTINIGSHLKGEFPFLYQNAGFFLILQLGVMAGWGADNIIISSVLGVAQVAIFAIVQRLYQFVAQPFSLINGPLWGAYADADARGDKTFIRKTLKSSLLLTFFGTIILAAVLFVLHGWIIKKWTHGEIVVPYELIIACGIWTVLEATGNAFAMFLNGAGIVKRQMIVVCTFIVLVLPLKFVLTDFWGLIGIPIATIIVYVIINAYFYGFLFFPDIKEKIRPSSPLQAQ